MEKQTKVTMKIDRDVYKKLQSIKIDNDLKTLSVAIDYLISKSKS